MAKVRGPLFSLDARGQFGDALLFRGGTHRTHVYQPADRSRINQQPASTQQATVRQRFGAAVAAWRALAAPERAEWNTRAQSTGRNVNGWNLFLGAFDGTQPPPPVPYSPPPISQPITLLANYLPPAVSLPVNLAA